jgi:adenosine deaminase
VSRAAGLLIVVVVAVSGSVAAAQAATDPQQRTARYFDSIRRQPLLLLAFLRDMPKGGDLHNHLEGAIYAESLIDFAAGSGLCVDRTTSFLLTPPCDVSCERYTSKPWVACAYQDQVLYNSMIDAWSMRNWNRGEESGHDHFFATFDKFLAAMLNHMGESMAEAAARAAADHVQYLELMHTADGMQSARLGAKLGWDDDFGRMRDKLLSGGLKDVIAATGKQLDDDEAKMRSALKCGSAEADPGCGVTVRFLYQVLRGLPREQVFAQILAGFELAKSDPRFVGLNLVMPEDWYVPMHDFELHMRMLDFLHGVYPGVHISLHAGELAMGLVPPEGLRFHIRESIERGHAERIGHGVSVMDERDPLGLLREMAQRNVLVEICLTSNDVILGVRGQDHPLPVYQLHGVPVALATDDEGVARSDMTHEYVRAVESYGLTYAEVKRMARQSLEHSFLPGASLWVETQQFRPVAACAGDRADAAKVSSGCEKFLEANERARGQWKLESSFANFERKF